MRVFRYRLQLPSLIYFSKVANGLLTLKGSDAMRCWPLTIFLAADVGTLSCWTQQPVELQIGNCGFKEDGHVKAGRKFNLIKPMKKMC
jgi:hypothetical protein